MIELAEKSDVTHRAIAAGWTLPEGFRVLAWLDKDTDIDPRTEGEAYLTDVNEEDANHRKHGFCKHCDGWIHELDQAGADAVNARHPASEDGEPVAVAGDWVEGPAGIKCPEVEDAHELGEPLAVAWWRHDRWEFVIVTVEVVDDHGRAWAGTSLGAVESGTFPYQVDKETGRIETKELDPITDPDHPLPDMIHTVLTEARAALIAHAANGPEIVPPPSTDQ